MLSPLKPLSRSLVLRSLKLAVPVAAAYVIIFLGLVSEFLIVGREMGGEGLAAVGLAGTLALVLVLSFHALEIATQAIAARRFGEKNLTAAGDVLLNSLFIAFVFGVPLTIGLYFVSSTLFWNPDKPVIANLAIEYFTWRLPGIPFLIGSLVMIGFFNAISKPTVPMFIYAGILVVNVVLCFCLVGGYYGAPELGIKGAALAQTISITLGFVVFTFILLSGKIKETYIRSDFWKALDWKIMLGLGKLSWPVFVQQFFGNLGMYLFILINSYVPDGGVSLSAATISRQIGYLTYLPGLGFGIAAGTVVGQLLGAGEKAKAREGGYICWMIGALFMVTVALLFILFPQQLVRLFFSAESATTTGAGASNYLKIQEMAGMMLIVIALYQIFEAFNSIVGKALQGAGSTFFVMVVSVGAQWLLFLPLAWFLAIPCEAGAYGCIYAMAIQLSFVAILFLWKYQSKSWLHRNI